ncbi:MAG: hypothetical protein FJ398_02990 [Verrucomicrobia bacterium]|nr:hypothetical protein [Verrucomicrobiota bacterium]
MNSTLHHACLTNPVLWSLLVSASCVVNDARVLDNFDDNKKSDWKDFTFQAGFGIPSETAGQFKFVQPPAGQAIFSASTKTSETYTLQDGRTIEFRVDLVKGNGKDAFAVLAFIPTASSVNTLAGYGFAKSTTDILITKGIGKYFVNENPAEPLKNENITLVLSLTGQGTSVLINARVLDKDNNNAVIFDRTVTDTPGADVLRNGTDSPAAPYFGAGNFVLYCYQDFDRSAPQDTYEVTYDNAEAFVLDHTVVDDFNDNTKTDWKDFTFVTGLGLPTETGGQFKFVQPPAGQALFSASTKTSRTFDLVEGERLELRVDLVSGNGKDAFAVMGFIPTTTGADTLAGYGLAKSTTDILITKGIGKYFHNENPTPALKNEKVTLVLSLEGRGTSVIINGKVLDKDNNNAVIFEKTYVDTAGPDVLRNGTDNPSAAYLGSGNFVLYCYQDFDRNAPQDSYEVIYDNAEIWAPPVAANTPPVISEVKPAEFANFLPASTPVSFKATDDKPLDNAKIEVSLNGSALTSATGLTITGAGNSRTVSFGGLAANANYAVEIKVTDSDNASAGSTLYFDTFSPNNLVIEIEDFNFGGGQFVDNPIVIPEGTGPQAKAYANQAGVQGTDYSDTRTSFQNVPYRPDDYVRMRQSLDLTRDKFTKAGGSAASVFDYDVGDIVAGEWMNYTRTFPAGTYEVYLRESLVNGTQVEAVLEKMTSDRSQPNQTTRTLGSFLAPRTGYLLRNIPLTDGLGKSKVIVRLSGLETLRLRQVSSAPSDGGIFQNYLVFVPVADPGLQRATVTGVSPAHGTTVESATPFLQATIQNRDTTVKTNSIALRVNNAVVTPTILSDANGATVGYALSPLPPPNSTVTARLTFSDNLDVAQTNEWRFTLTYKALDTSIRVPGPGLARGLNLRLVQAPQGSALENSLQRAENQLAANSTIPAAISTNFTADVINFNKTEGPRGNFENDAVLPHLDPAGNGLDDFAVEITAYLELSAGIHRFGVVSDDGYKISSSRNISDASATPLEFHNGGPANETFDFVVPESGLYPFRMVWYERGGAGYAEWFSVDIATGERTLINDPANAKAVKAYRTVTPAPAVRLETALAVTGPFAAEASAIVDAQVRTITIPLPREAARFFRINSDAPKKISSIKIAGNQIVIAYQ